MGIASLILGILSFLISFTFFVDLGLILGILAVVLGIIAIVKKVNKGMAIAGVILGGLALMITFGADSSTDVVTGTGVTSDPSVTTQSKVVVSTENIEIEKAGITKSGDFVIKVTNNNDGAVCLSDIITVYKDSAGNFLKKVSAYESYICIPAKSHTYVYNWGYDDKFETYSNYEFSCELASYTDEFIFNGLDITSNDTGEQIAVTVANNTGETIERVNVNVVYYKGEEIVGIEYGWADESVTEGNNAYINVDYPVDSNYDDVAFDRFAVYYVRGEIQQ